MSLANRRTYQRYMVSKEAVLQVSDEIIRITTADVSMGGISFKGSTSLSMGQMIKLKFSDNSEEQIDAEVVWCSKTQEYGLKFVNLSDTLKFQIQSWTQGLVPTN